MYSIGERELLLVNSYKMSIEDELDTEPESIGTTNEFTLARFKLASWVLEELDFLQENINIDKTIRHKILKYFIIDI